VSIFGRASKASELEKELERQIRITPRLSAAPLQELIVQTHNQLGEIEPVFVCKALLT
jgi:hypothetical protein